jgi:phosphate transport system substrate-binding protein
MIKASLTLSITLTIGLLAGISGLIPGAAEARDQIRIVGSSTVYPFATAVAEEFGNTSGFPTPVIESTGSGGGLKLFCSGIGENYPDITNASRRIKASEVEKCDQNGIDKIIEVKIGFDGIVIANSNKSEPVSISLRQIYLALAKDVPDSNGNLVPNPYKNWSDIDYALPKVKIEVLGPPPTSGTRDAFVELGLEGGCKTFDSIAAIKKSDKKAYKAICHTIREDGAYVEAGENDNLIIKKLVANPSAFGVFGYSFLEENRDMVQGAIVDSVQPTFDNIAGGAYPISRSLYFYVKQAHVDVIPGIREYLAEFTSEETFGDYGYLTEKGLIPMPESDRELIRNATQNLSPLSM